MKIERHPVTPVAAMPTRPATPPPAGDGGVARTPSPDARRIAKAIERLAAAVELLAAPPPEPGPCSAVCPIGLVRRLPCTLRAGHAGQHEHASVEGFGRWSDEDGASI